MIGGLLRKGELVAERRHMRVGVDDRFQARFDGENGVAVGLRKKVDLESCPKQYLRHKQCRVMEHRPDIDFSISTLLRDCTSENSSVLILLS